MSLDRSDQAEVVTDLRSIVTSCNAAAEALLGYTADELVGRHIRTLIPSERLGEEDDLVEQVRSGRHGTFETIRVTKDGRRLEIALTASPVVDDDGKVVGISRVFRNITEQKQSLAAQGYLAAIVESSDDAIISKGLDGTIRSCNRAAERIFGYSRDELIGRNIRLLIPADRQAEEEEILARISRGERVDHFETIRVAKDGRKLNISLTVSPVRDESGTIIGASKVARDITEQRRGTAAQAFLAAIVRSSEDAIIAKDLDGIIQSCNPAAERMFGYGADELIGHPVRKLIPPERQAEEDDILLRLRNGERIEHFETVRVTKDGRPLDISLTVSPVYDASGQIIGVSKIARDITERKRAEAELAAQQEWFRVTLGSIGDAVIASDAQGRLTYMNAHAERLTGWMLTETMGRPLHDVFRIVNEKTRQPVANPADVVMRTGTVVGLANHTVLIGRSGTERPIADSAAPIRDQRGAILGVVLVFRDVTEERRAEEALAEQREWFETTLESIGDAVIATDVQGHVVFMNPVAEHLTGWQVDAAQGRPCAEVFNIINEQTRRSVDSPVTHVLAEGTIVGLANHTLLIAADGTERPIDDSGAPIRNRDGRIVGVVLVFRDVTERRRAETERQAAIVERERLLEAERAARAEAERASRVKDEFVAMVSHELRTPLNAILGWTQLMATDRGREDPAVIERGVDIITRNTRLQAQLISDLLDVSRIVSGKLQLSMQAVDLTAIVEEAVETLLPDAAAKGLTIEREIERRLGPIAGDPARLQQIVWNLLSNAIKFTPRGGRIVVSLVHQGEHAELTVADTGPGIRPEVLPHIFERFQQADPSITRRFGGLGLGLSIVKHLVDLHGGAVSAESPGEGQGARFSVRLPAGAGATASSGSEPSRSEEALAGLLDPISLEGIRILLVEDEPDTREFLKRLLESHGAMVVPTMTATEALSAFADETPHILVSDIGLPEVDGYDLMQRIRRERPGIDGTVPAIALTAYARSEDRTRALRAGYQAHLAKPIEPSELLATISSLLALTGRDRQRPV